MRYVSRERSESTSYFQHFTNITDVLKLLTVPYVLVCLFGGQVTFILSHNIIFWVNLIVLIRYVLCREMSRFLALLVYSTQFYPFTIFT